MEKKNRLTVGDCVVIFAGILAGAWLVYNEYPGWWWPLGALAGGAVGYLLCKPMETLQALGVVARDFFVHVLGNGKMLGTWLLWSVALSLPVLTVTWIGWTLGVWAEPPKGAPPPDLGTLFQAAYSTAVGFGTSWLWTLEIAIPEILLGLFLASVYVYRNDSSVRPGVALRLIAFANPVSGWVVTLVLMLIVVAGYFISNLPNIVWEIAEYAIGGVVLSGILYGAWRLVVMIHCQRREVCFLYATAGSVIGGLGAHQFPALLVKFDQFPQLPPESFAIVATGALGVALALSVRWFLEEPIQQQLAQWAAEDEAVAIEVDAA